MDMLSSMEVDNESVTSRSFLDTCSRFFVADNTVAESSLMNDILLALAREPVSVV